jgi:D-alanine-D-alanine ligase
MSESATSFGRVGVLYGGRSSEREISLMSGRAVLEALRSRGVDAHAFDPGLQPIGELERAGFDRAFIALHGRFGEDGTIQGVLETLRIPYTGCGVQASSIALDKLVTKRLWVWAGIPTPAWRELEADGDYDAVFRELGGQVVVKPRSEGSTIGLTKVISNEQGELKRAFAEARRYDTRVLAEELVVGRELTCAILGTGFDAQALPLIEIRAPQGNYDYQNKYFNDDTEYLCPAPLDAPLEQRIQRLCLQAYAIVGARGWARVDVMLKPAQDGAQPLLLELNTSPGMTGHSLVPMAARVAGMDFGDLVVRILSEATLEVKP